MDTDFGNYGHVNAMDGAAAGSVFAPTGPVSGGADASSIPWGTIGMALIIILVIIVIWRFSNFRQDRVCISTDLSEYWPSGYISGVPRLPGQDYLPRLSGFLPAESVVAARDKWTVNSNLLSSVLMGN